MTVTGARIINDPVKRSQAMKNEDRETLNVFINAPLKAAKASAIIKSMTPLIGWDILDRRSLNIKKPQTKRCINSVNIANLAVFLIKASCSIKIKISLVGCFVRLQILQGKSRNPKARIAVLPHSLENR